MAATTAAVVVTGCGEASRAWIVLRAGVGDAVGVGVGDAVGVGVKVGLVLCEGTGVELAVDDPVVGLPEQPTMARATSSPARPRLVARETDGRAIRAEAMPLQEMYAPARGRIDIFWPRVVTRECPHVQTWSPGADPIRRGSVYRRTRSHVYVS
jgi:hypothetical protein